MKMNVKKMLLSMLSVAVVSASLGATVYAASNKYYTPVWILVVKRV